MYLLGDLQIYVGILNVKYSLAASTDCVKLLYLQVDQILSSIAVPVTASSYSMMREHCHLCDICAPPRSSLGPSTEQEQIVISTDQFKIQLE